MKKIMTKSLMFMSVAGVLLALSACKKDFDKINSNPNSPQSVPNNYLLSGAEKGLMDNTWDRWWNGTTGMLLAQYYAENQYTDESQYQFRNTTIKDYWTSFYAGGIPDQYSQSTTTFPEGGLKELQTIINNCKADTAKANASGAGYFRNQIAVATILEVWIYQNMTDTWGDIPYSEALQDVKNTQPKYDKQSDIYPALLARLDTALSIADVTKTDLKGDLVYNGDLHSWVKFGNSLRLRLAIRIADVNPTLAANEITKAVAGGLFTSNSDNALFKYIDGSPNYNPLYYDRVVTGRQDFCSSNTIIDVMNSLNDGRIGIYFDTAANGGFVGRPYGQSSSNAGGTPIGSVSQQGQATIQPTSPGVYLDYAQVEFMLAEAAARGMGGVSDAAGHYTAGINASFNFWSGTDAPASYLSQPSVDYAALLGSGQDYRHIIGKQKWLALYMQGIQGWIEWRRLDFGILQATADPQLQGNGVPVRMTYPYSEQTLNPKGYNQALTNQGPDLLTTKVWWDIH